MRTVYRESFTVTSALYVSLEAGVSGHGSSERAWMACKEEEVGVTTSKRYSKHTDTPAIYLALAEQVVARLVSCLGWCKPLQRRALWCRGIGNLHKELGKAARCETVAAAQCGLCKHCALCTFEPAERWEAGSSMRSAVPNTDVFSSPPPSS